MNILNNMEGIFFVAVTVACAMIFAFTPAPTISVNVSGPLVSQEAAMPVVTVTAKRLA